MFRARDPQESLWQSQFLVTPKKAKRLEGSWAEVFRNEALPLIDEELFAPMYCADNGRPNRAVQTVLGVHLLKEMFNLTDGEALEQLEFNLLWHHALRLDIEETHLPQKTLHNFRVRLMQHDGGRLAFQETTDRIIQALGIRTGKQRLDSTHIMSNIATLTRLGSIVPAGLALGTQLKKEMPWAGLWPEVIRRVSEHHFFTDKVAFSNRRYQYRELAARFLLLTTTDTVGDTKKVYLDNMVQTFKDNGSGEEANIVGHEVEDILGTVPAVAAA